MLPRIQHLKSTSRILIRAILLLGWPLLFLNSCHVKQVPTQIEPAPIIKSSFVLVKEVNFTSGLFYLRKLKAGTKWDFVNTITQGDVFKTKDQILTLEASNIFEVYIVISSNILVGFYLPVEKTFSPLGYSQELEKRDMKSN